MVINAALIAFQALCPDIPLRRSTASELSGPQDVSKLKHFLLKDPRIFKPAVLIRPTAPA